MDTFFLLNFRIFLAGICCLLFTPAAHAGHIAGGDFTVRHIEGNTFEAKLILYRDCAGTSVIDGSINIAVFDALTDQYLPSLSFIMTNPTEDVIPLANSCYDTGLCVEAQTYIQNITLPDNPNGYYMSWERCCRNVLALNVFTLDQAMVFTVEVPDPVLQNSSPQFFPYPSETFLCVNGETTIDFGATDIDGDSLVYTLITPLRGNATSFFNPTVPQGAFARPYPPLNWSAGYDITDPVGGDLPMTLDSQTGLATAQPNAIGFFSLAVQVEEFRNGVRIGAVIREVQIASLVCNLDLPSEILTPNNDTLFNILANAPFCIDIVISDPNGTDTLYVEVTGELFDGTILPLASFPEGEGFGTIEQEFCWSPVCDNLLEEGLYSVTISAFSVGCANEILVTTQTLYFNVYIEEDEPTELAAPVLDTGLPGVIIDLYDPSTHCFDFVFEDPNAADSLFVTASSDIFGLPNAQTLEPDENQGTLTLPFCWNVTCGDVRDEPYFITFEVLTTNCEVEETYTFVVPVFVVVPENEPTVFNDPFLDSYTFEFYSADTFKIPVNVTDANFFDTLAVTASSSIFSLPQNAAIFDRLDGLVMVDGMLCWAPTCEMVRPEPYTVTFTATAFSCKTDDEVTKTIEIFLELPPESPPFFELPNPGTLIDHTVGGDPITFTVIARDGNAYDTLHLSATSPVFEAAGRPAEFSPFTNTEIVFGDFVWDPTCADISEEPYTVTFEVNSRSCQKNVSTFLDVEISVTTPTRGEIKPIPNVFTPNGDGVNDFWTIENKDDVCLLNFRALVFDRWGRQVYETNNPAFEWNGDWGSGDRVSDGTLFHTIEYFYKNRVRSYSGNIVVLGKP